MITHNAPETVRARPGAAKTQWQAFLRLEIEGTDALNARVEFIADKLQFS